MKNEVELSAIVERIFSRTDRCTDDLVRVLRFAIEWISIGQPNEKREEYVSCMLPDFDDCCVSPEKLLSGKYTDEFLEYLIDVVIESFVGKRRNFQWCPYLLKGAYSHDLLVANYDRLIAVGWPDDEVLTLAIVNMIDSDRVNEKVVHLLTSIVENAQDGALSNAARAKITAK